MSLWLWDEQRFDLEQKKKTTKNQRKKVNEKNGRCVIGCSVKARARRDKVQNVWCATTSTSGSFSSHCGSCACIFGRAYIGDSMSLSAGFYSSSPLSSIASRAAETPEEKWAKTSGTICRVDVAMCSWNTGAYLSQKRAVRGGELTISHIIRRPSMFSIYTRWFKKNKFFTTWINGPTVYANGIEINILIYSLWKLADLPPTYTSVHMRASLPLKNLNAPCTDRGVTILNSQFFFSFPLFLTAPIF